MTDLPDKIIGSFNAEPRFQHPADTESPILTSEEAPRALQHPPEHYEAFLRILDCNHIKIDFDQMTLTK
jgi:hypothetical protein